MNISGDIGIIANKMVGIYITYWFWCFQFCLQIDMEESE